MSEGFTEPGLEVSVLAQGHSFQRNDGYLTLRSIFTMGRLGFEWELSAFISEKHVISIVLKENHMHLTENSQIQEIHI